MTYTCTYRERQVKREDISKFQRPKDVFHYPDTGSSGRSGEGPLLSQ